MEEKNPEGMEPVSQLYVKRHQEDGSKSQWQVNTTSLRVFLERKLKGLVLKEYNQYLIISKGETLEELWLETDEEAQKKYEAWIQSHKEPEKARKETTLKKTEENFEKFQRGKDRLLPDEECDHILNTIDPLFSQIGYLTQYSEEDINKVLRSNLFEIRTYLTKKCVENPEEVKLDKAMLVMQLVKNMLHPILKAAEQGFTAKGLRETIQEKMITSEQPKKMFGLGG